MNLTLLGSFRLGSQYAYGGRSLAFDAENQSLFISANDQPSPNQIGEVRIPATLGTGAVSALPTAQSKQAPANIGRWSRAPRGVSSAMKSGGLIVWGQRLIGTVFEYYDADGNAVDSHYQVMDKNNLGTSTVNGCYKVGNEGGGYSGEYLCTVPSNWQAQIGKPMLCGGSTMPINTRTSNGPCALAFDPSQLAGGAATAPVVNLLSYPNWHGSTSNYQHPDDHPLRAPDSRNDYYNTSSEIKGCVWAEGTDEIVFFGSHGTGPWSYTQNGSSDPGRPNDNIHAYPYRYQTWTYTAQQLLEVKNGIKQPWEPQPVVTALTLPYTSSLYRAGGVAYDSAGGRVFIAQPFADGANPVVHVYSIGSAPPSDTTAPVISLLQVTDITETSAMVEWMTDEPSTTLVDYHANGGLFYVFVDSTKYTYHRAPLTNLSPGTTYNYRVQSVDAAGNTATSLDYTFATLSPPPPPTDPCTAVIAERDALAAQLAQTEQLVAQQVAQISTLTVDLALARAALDAAKTKAAIGLGYVNQAKAALE